MTVYWDKCESKIVTLPPVCSDRQETEHYINIRDGEIYKDYVELLSIGKTDNCFVSLQCDYQERLHC